MEDRVTNLPDELLCHILSFLPTKEAIATTILSKRWTNLWRSVSTLDFNDSTYGGDKHSRFIQSVYAVLLSRNLNQPIKKFRLRCSIRPSLLDSDYASFWVDAVLQRRAEHIDISLPFVSPIRVHSNLCFFNCRTLVVLKLKGIGLNLKHFSSVVELPLVKVLHMQTVLLPDCGSFADILTGCPVLEDLKARNLYFTKYDNEREFNILPKLVRAEISWEPLDIFMVKLVNNVNFLRIRDIDFRLLPYGGEDIDMFHNLTRVELVYTGHTRDWLDVVEFLKYCPKLQVLVIKQPQVDGYYTVGELRGNDWQYPSSVPKCILFHLKECYLNNYRGTKGEFKFARYIMRNGRFLKKMTICKCTAVKQLGKPNDIKKLFSCSARSATCKLYFKI